MSSILDHFPHPTVRDGQRYVLEKVERLWHMADVFVIVAPTGFGKSALSSTIAHWNGNGSVIVPTNMLAKQMARETGLATINNKATYSSPVAYQLARKALSGGCCVLNYYQYLANRAYNDVLIADEAHGVISFLQDKEAIKLWGHLDGFELGQFTTTGELLQWLEVHERPTASIKKAKAALSRSLDHYVIEEVVDLYKGISRDCIKLIPLTPRDNKPILWPPHRVQKIVLMSATFNEEDLYDLGLDTRRVVKIEAPSPIPVENRPFKYWPIANMSYKHQSASMPIVVDWVRKALGAHRSKGLLHCTYSMSGKLRLALKDEPRIMWHNKYNKGEVYKQWLRSPPSEGRVLIGCGMTEGLDLKYDTARWQAILKVPYPNLKEPAIAEKLRQRPASYQWSAAKQVIQAAGRVSRAADDFGVTYCLDNSFGRLYNNNKELFPAFFKDSVEFVKVDYDES